MADIIHVELLSVVSKSERPLYEGRLIDMTSNQWLGRDL